MCVLPAKPAHATLSDDAFAEMLLSNTRLVQHVIRRALPEQLAEMHEDLVQDALLFAWRRRANYDPTRLTRNGKPPIGYWLSMQAKSVVYDLLRTRIRRFDRMEAAGHGSMGVVSLEATKNRVEPADHRRTDPAELAERAEIFDAIERAKTALPPTERDALEARLARTQFKDIDPTVTKETARQRVMRATTRIATEVVPKFSG
jgi:RNA polymerase sigma factor (sigma-70 family)